MSPASDNPVRPGDDLIDRIVREVLLRLADTSTETTTPPALPSVITADDVEAVPSGGALTVSEKAVVTPAARDILRARKVQLVRTGAPAANSASRVVVLHQDGSGREIEPDDELVRRTVASLQDGAVGAVVVVRHPHRLVVKLNRHALVVAAVVLAGHEEALREDDFFPNVLVTSLGTPQALVRRWYGYLAESASRRGMYGSP